LVAKAAMKTGYPVTNHRNTMRDSGTYCFGVLKFNIWYSYISFIADPRVFDRIIYSSAVTAQAFWPKN
jgi:hypothetical protein